MDAIATERGVSPAIISLAWLCRQPIFRAFKPKHIDDAIATFSIARTDDETKRLEAPYTPRRDGEGTSDSASLAQILEAVSGFKKDTPDLIERKCPSNSDIR